MKNILSIFKEPAVWFVILGVIIAAVIIKAFRAFVVPMIPGKAGEVVSKIVPLIAVAAIGWAVGDAHAAAFWHLLA